jgi:hypothetical protein
MLAHHQAHGSLSPLVNETDRMSALFTAALVLPEQFSDSPDRAYRTCGEVALMRAVFDDAIRCFLRQLTSNKRRDQQLAEEATAWFFSDDEQHVFSFLNICAVLGFEPQYIRLGLQRWQRRAFHTRWRKRRHVVRGRQALAQSL